MKKINIAQIMEENHLTAAQLAKLLGVTTATFQKWQSFFSELSPAGEDKKGKPVYKNTDTESWKMIAEFIQKEKLSLEEAQAAYLKKRDFEQRRAQHLENLQRAKHFLQQLEADL